VLHSFAVRSHFPQTFFLLSGISIAWLVGLVYLQSVRHPVIDPETGFVQYRVEEAYRLLKWPYLFAIVWIFHFLVACQHFVTGSSVCRWYFLRHKQELESPIANSYWILFRYSLGSIALGSLVVSGIKLLRLVFQRIHKMMTKDRDDSCSGPLKCCACFLWIFEKILIFVNTNAYIEIALTGKSFCSSARRAFSVLTMNALQVTAVNSVGDFLLFISKAMIVLVTLWTGNKLVEDRQSELSYSWSPLIVSGLSAYFVAHCFLSVYEMAIDALFICFCENREAERSDSSNTRPSFTNRTLVDVDDEDQ
jgi:solute carrier family 44 protein 1 (choline transporter-like protein)